MTTIDLQEELDEAIRTDPTQFLTLDGEPFDRSTTLSASAIGRCARALVFERGGWPEDPGTTVPYGIFDRGHAVEYQVEKRLRQMCQAHGLELEYAGGEQRTLVSGNLSATPDGLIVNRTNKSITLNTGGVFVCLDPGDSLVIELKSVDPRTNIGVPKPVNVKQVELQIELFNLCTNHTPQYGLIIQTDTSDHSRRAFHLVERSTRSDYIDTARDRAAQILSCEDPADVKAEGRINGACQYCNYTTACGQAILRHFPEVEEVLEGEEAEQLDELCEQLDRLKDDRDAITRDLKEQEENVKEFLTSRDVCKGTTESYRVLYSAVRGRKRFNIKELEHEFPDIAERPELWSDGPSNTRLTVTKKG